MRFQSQKKTHHLDDGESIIKKLGIRKFFVQIGLCLSPIFSLFCLFLACGRSPGQDVNIIVTTPQSYDDAFFTLPVHVSFHLENFGNIFLNKTLLPGENRIFLPKGPFQVSTVFFAEQLSIAKTINAKSHDDIVPEQFVYGSVQQDVVITTQTRSIEIYYPKLKPVQYRKFGLVFKEKLGKDIVPISNTQILIQDPLSEAIFISPLNGNHLKFITDKNGFASVDIPIFDSNDDIRLLIPQKYKYDKALILPVEDVDTGFQFYEILVDQKKSTFKQLFGTDYYLDSTETIGSRLEAGKNPRFLDVMTKDKYQEDLTDMFRQTSETIDVLEPLLKANMQLRGADPYVRSGRVIQIQCKPHQGSMYQTCDRYLSRGKLKEDFFVNSQKDMSVDFLLIDQDGYNIFAVKDSKKDTASVVTIHLN